MANSFIQTPTDGSGKKLDTWTTTTLAQHRQAVVIGAKDTDANVAPVDATAGLKVDLGADNDIRITDGTDIALIDTNGSIQALIKDGSGNSVTFEPSVAHDAADSGNSVKIGAKATTALSGLTLVADADRTNLFAGIDGVLLTRPHTNLEGIVSGNATNTDGTSTQCIAAQAAGIKTYLTSIILCNTSASNITVDIKDGTTVKVSMPVPANSGSIFNPPVPIPGTAATAWNFDPSAAATTVTCSMIGFKSKV